MSKESFLRAEETAARLVETLQNLQNEVDGYKKLNLVLDKLTDSLSELVYNLANFTNHIEESMKSISDSLQDIESFNNRLSEFIDNLKVYLPELENSLTKRLDALLEEIISNSNRVLEKIFEDKLTEAIFKMTYQNNSMASQNLKTDGSKKQSQYQLKTNDFKDLKLLKKN